jgi:hypothetical protein
MDLRKVPIWRKDNDTIRLLTKWKRFAAVWGCYLRDYEIPCADDLVLYMFGLRERLGGSARSLGALALIRAQSPAQAIYGDDFQCSLKRRSGRHASDADAFLSFVEDSLEFFAVIGLGTACFLGIDFGTTGSGQFSDLGAQVLVLARHPGISDQHFRLDFCKQHFHAKCVRSSSQKYKWKIPDFCKPTTFTTELSVLISSSYQRQRKCMTAVAISHRSYIRIIVARVFHARPYAVAMDVS